MNTEIVSTDQDRPTDLQLAGQAASTAAAHYVFADFRARKAANTIRAQDADLNLFAEFLTGAGVQLTAELNENPGAWAGVTWGLVTAFRQWLLGKGYAVSSLNRALSTVKKYATLAFTAGAIDLTEHALIRQVSGYADKEVPRIDQKRDQTRRGHKKAEHRRIGDDQARRLKKHDETATGRRDTLLMCLLLDHGLRVGEIALLQVDSIRLDAGELTFYRPKVAKQQLHALSIDTLAAARAWLKLRGETPGALLLPVKKSGEIVRKANAGSLTGLTENALRKRVRFLGDAIGVDHLSPHDLRHYWTTYWSKRIKKLPRGLFTLQEAGGWNSLTMPRRYAEAAEIANEGMV